MSTEMPEDANKFAGSCAISRRAPEATLTGGENNGTEDLSGAPVDLAEDGLWEIEPS